MRRQIEKNKEILLDEMEKLGDRKLTPESVAALGAYYKAHKALRMICDHTAGQRALYGHEEHHATDGGRARGEERPTFTHETAMAWVGRMKNEDGTTGPHWTMEQTEQTRKQRKIDCDPLKFFVAMNMMYSDYCKAAEKSNASSMDFYAYMSEAFLDDKDAQPDKLERYYHCIAKK